MTGHATTPLAEELSSDPLHRVTQYQTAAAARGPAPSAALQELREAGRCAPVRPRP